MRDLNLQDLLTLRPKVLMALNSKINIETDCVETKALLIMRSVQGHYIIMTLKVIA